MNKLKWKSHWKQSEFVLYTRTVNISRGGGVNSEEYSSIGDN